MEKYYWIKLRTDFFNQETIDFLLSQKNGCEYVVLYQMLCLQTANTNGTLANQIGEVIIPYNIEKIVRDTKYFDYDTIVVALELYKQIGLIYVEEDGNLKITDIERMVGSESATREAIKKREQRLRKKIEQGTKVGTKCLIDIDNRDKDIDNIKENNIKESKHKYGEYKNVLLTDKELQSLKSDYTNYEELIRYLDEYIEMKGYKAKSHYLCIKKWVIDAVKRNEPNIVKQPNWMNKDNEREKMTDSEIKEMEELLSEFKK